MSLHFKHRNQDERCDPVLETLLHKSAKRIISTHRQILLPDHHKIFTYQEAHEEKGWNKYRPDLTLATEDKPIYVEIVVSNPISTDKELAYFQHQADCLIIDLSGYEKLFAMSDLERDVLQNLENRSFLPQYQYLKSAYPLSIDNKSDDTIFKIIIGAATGFGAGCYLYNRFFKPKK